jgi:FtsP/CotA-like multicopper oxidase with cupredoxin domain
MHMHGGPFTVVARDGIPLGKWIFHCHIPHHTLNNNQEERGGGGLTVLVDVSP